MLEKLTFQICKASDNNSATDVVTNTREQITSILTRKLQDSNSPEVAELVHTITQTHFERQEIETKIRIIQAHVEVHIKFYKNAGLFLNLERLDTLKVATSLLKLTEHQNPLTNLFGTWVKTGSVTKLIDSSPIEKAKQIITELTHGDSLQELNYSLELSREIPERAISSNDTWWHHSSESDINQAIRKRSELMEIKHRLEGMIQSINASGCEWLEEFQLELKNTYEQVKNILLQLQPPSLNIELQKVYTREPQPIRVAKHNI